MHSPQLSLTRRHFLRATAAAAGALGFPAILHSQNKGKKHVYSEKPLTRDVREARLVAQVAKEVGVVTQMGTQLHASANYHRVVELVQSGAIGPVREAHVWVSRAWGWQSKEDAEKNKD